MIDMPPNSLDLAETGHLRDKTREDNPSEFLKKRVNGLMTILYLIDDGLTKRTDIPEVLDLLRQWESEYFVFSQSYNFEVTDRCTKGTEAVEKLELILEVALGERCTSDFVDAEPINDSNTEYLNHLQENVKNVIALWMPWACCVANSSIQPKTYTDTYSMFERPYSP